MTLTLNQSDLYRFERLVSKLVKPSDAPASVCFIPNSSGFKLSVFCKDATLTMSITKQGFADPFSIQWSDFKTLAVKKDVVVAFGFQDNSVHCHYGDEQRWFDVNRKVNTLPTVPKTTAANDKTILGVLNTLAKCADTDNNRGALNGICLRGATSQIIATTGIQLLAQEGFKFPFNEDVICPVSKIFGSKELNDITADNVSLGQTNGWVYFGIGEVEIVLRALVGKFPNITKIVQPAENTTYLEITQVDADFILEKLDKLPGKKEHQAPLWFSLDKQIQLRAYDSAQKTGITLELKHSAFTGKNVTVSMNREYLKNALKFGCLRFGFDPTHNTPAICFGEQKTYVFMPLTSMTEPVVEAERMNVITSTITATTMKATTTPEVPVKRRKRRTANPDTVKPLGKIALLQSAEQIRQDLRSSLLQINTLIKEMKAQRSKDKLLQNTMDSLRKLSLV